MKGLLYVVCNEWIRNPETGKMPYKIGITGKTVDERYYGLGLKMPGTFKTLFAYEFNDCSDAENLIQRLFKNYRVNGEWFEIGEELLEQVRKNCEIMGGILATEETQKGILDETEEPQKGTGRGPSTGNGGTISKSDAISLVNKKRNLCLNNNNTMFSTINEAVEQWSFNRQNKYFNDDMYMILVDQHNKKLHCFFIEGGEISSPRTTFNQRNDKRVKDKSIITITVSAYNFKEQYSGFVFGKYKLDTFSY